MEEKDFEPQSKEGQDDAKASDGLAAYLAAEKEEEAWLAKMQAAAKTKKEDKPTSR